MTVYNNRFGCKCEVKPEPMPEINYFARRIKLDKTKVSVGTKKGVE